MRARAAARSASHRANIRSIIMGTHGSPYARFQLAVRSGNLPLIHAAASDLGWVPLRDAPAILLVIDSKAEERFESAASAGRGGSRSRSVELTLEEFAGALESLVALPDENAQRSLLALCGRAVRPAGVRAAPTGVAGVAAPSIPACCHSSRLSRTAAAVDSC